MATQHVSYHSEFGIALHERGLNNLSAALRAAQPKKFAFRTEIPIVPANSESAGHILILYAVADEPLAFNLYPVEATPKIVVDGFFVAANILFTLTDSQLGTITRIRVKVEASGQVVQRDDKLFVRLLNKPDGSPWFDIIELRGEHPHSGIRLVGGALNSDGEIANALGVVSDDNATVSTFHAIMDYLITLFLREGLTRTVTEFPLPDLNDIIDAGPLGKLPGRRIYIRNDSLYLTLGEALAGDGGFPDGMVIDLRIGATQRGLRRIVNTMPPMPIPINIGDDRSTIRIYSNDFEISSINFNLRPGHDEFLGFVFFGGTLDLLLQFEVFGHWVRTPNLPLPIDASLSHFGGLFLAYIQADGDNIQLRIRPDQNFFEAWYLFVATNYRQLFSDLFKTAAEKVHDQLRRNKFCKVPIIGWFVCGVIDLFGEVLGWLTGAVLDRFMSEFLNAIIFTIGRALLQRMNDRTFRIFELEQDKIYKMTGLKVRNGSVHQVADGRDGELQLWLGFAEGGFPPPPAPLPTPPLTEPKPLPPFPSPAPDMLPEYLPADFQPLLALPASDWQENYRETFRVETTTNKITSIGTLTFSYNRNGKNWRLTKMVQMASGDIEAEFHADYAEDQTRPLRGDYVCRMISSGTRIELRHAIDFTVPGKATVSTKMPDGSSWETVVDVEDTRYLEFEEMWLFRLSYCDLIDGTTGKFARIEVSDALEYKNWARQIPVEITVRKGQIIWPPDSDESLPVWIVEAEGEEDCTLLKIDKKGGLLTAKIVHRDNELYLTRTVEAANS